MAQVVEILPNGRQCTDTGNAMATEHIAAQLARASAILLGLIIFDHVRGNELSVYVLLHHFLIYSINLMK